MFALSVRRLIQHLRLRPHPEGGFYRETYRSSERITLPNGRRRHVSTAIYFLLPRGNISRFHRIQSDEIWHFHLGGPLEIVEIDSRGKPRRTLLGSCLSKGHVLQHVVPAGRWFGAKPIRRTAFALVSCTVSPGFDFADLDLGDRTTLLKRFPKARREILKLTLPSTDSNRAFDSEP